MASLTLCIRYTLDPNLVRHFRTYAENEQPIIERAGGKIVAYWAPTEFAGPTNIAYGLIDFPSLADYERYRKVLAEDPEHRRIAQMFEQSGVVIAVERAFIERIDYDKK